jgi:hypothetical protein
VFLQETIPRTAMALISNGECLKLKLLTPTIVYIDTDDVLPWVTRTFCSINTAMRSTY